MAKAKKETTGAKAPDKKAVNSIPPSERAGGVVKTNTSAAAIPAPLAAELKSGKPLSPVTYEGLMLNIDLVRNAIDASANLYKAMAMEDLAKAANNHAAERQVREIRLAAVYVLGERLTETERAKGGRPSNKVTKENPSHDDTGSGNPSHYDMGSEKTPTLKAMNLTPAKPGATRTSLGEMNAYYPNERVSPCCGNG